MRELGEDKPCLKGWEEWQSENEEWRGPQRGGEKGRAGTPDGVGTAEGDVLTQDRSLGRVKETERTDQRQTGRQRARELSLEARVEHEHSPLLPGTWTGAGGGRRAEREHTYRSTDWRAERARLLVKGADRALGGCRSSMDLLQDRSLSNAPSSPLSRPSKSNLEQERTHMRTHRTNSVPSPLASPSLPCRLLWQQEARQPEEKVGLGRRDPTPVRRATGTGRQSRHRQQWGSEETER